MGQIQALLDDGDQHISGDRDPYLGLHRVLAGAQKRLDAQMLLDPLEEQLHLPALLVQSGDHFRRQREIVGQRHRRRNRAVVVDVGINDLNGKTVGDIDYESLKGIAESATPVPGGVGSVTTTMLLENIYEAYLCTKCQ